MGVKPRPFPQAAVGAQQAGVHLGEGGKVRAADLFLALDDPANGDRQFAVCGQQGSYRSQAGGDLALVVGSAPGVQFAIAHGGLKGRRVPQVKRVGRLHVIVIVKQERKRAAPLALAIDCRGRALDAESLCAEPGVVEQRLDQGSGLVYAHVLGTDARLATELFEQQARFVGVRV